MKRVCSAWLIVVCLSTIVAAEQARAGSPDRLDVLLDAIAQVESNGDSTATGDGGKALGMFQIHRAYWADGTRFLGVDWSYAQARNPVKARAVVRAYLHHYGRGRSLLDMARIHNGGPNGHTRQSTLRYARRIAGILDTLAAETACHTAAARPTDA